MDLNLRALTKIAGVLLLVLGGTMILPLIVGLIYREPASVRAFLAVILPCLVAGGALAYFPKTKSHQFRIRDGYLIVSVSWMIASLVGAIPFVISGAIPSYVDAVFETCSGFSTTGASILPDIEALPQSMLFWRSFTHWIGGMGILIFAIALLPALGLGGQFLAKAESPGPTLSKLTPKISDTAKMFYILYSIYTIAEILLLMAGGMNLFDACIHTFGSVGTGGFSNYNYSVIAFDSASIDGIITLFMFLSGTSYFLYFLVLRRGPRAFFRDGEFKVYFAIVAAATILITLGLWGFGVYETPLQAFRYGIFQVVSIVTTTGFANADFVLWPTFCQMILFLLFFVGGCSSSTAGGIKPIRLLVLGKLVGRTAELKLHPSSVKPLKLDNRILPVEVPSGIAAFTFLYILMFFAGGILVSLDNVDFISSFSASGSCLGNIGPGFGVIGPLSNYSVFSDGSTIVLSFLMIAGRLELFTLILLFTKKFWYPYG
jgi:trk system potassium uptake protein TrkH